MQKTPATPVDDGFQRCILPVTDNDTVAGNGTNEVMKLGLDGIQVRIDIYVVKFEVVEDQDIGAVMNKLGPLIKKCGVVFVRFDNEIPLAIAG